jgi:hypothetical protein
MDNLYIYNAVRTVPAEAKKEIKGGRMNGKTDVNPMWRIKALTEQFGPCGIGWKYEITRRDVLPGANDEVAAFVDINLYIKVDGAWSEAIPGTGGNMFVSKERNGLYVSDECFKMALTDAISVSCKALGVAADVYWDKDRTKYDARPDTPPALCPKCGLKVNPTKAKDGTMMQPEQVLSRCGGMCTVCYKKQKQEERNA